MRVHYEHLCTKGLHRQTNLTRANNDVRDAAIKIQDAEDADYPTGRLREYLIDCREDRKQAEIELQRHVAHCADGCKRARGGDLAFAHVNQAGVNSRAPSHQKPPVPGAGELAARIRDGATVDDLATEYERDPSTIRQRVLQAGYSGTTGEPTHRPRTPLELILGRIDDQPWAEDALCAQTDPESFYPEKGGSTREAKAVCASCLVQAECLDYALDHDERFGIWGGLSERERRRIKQRITHPLNTHQESA